MIDGPESQVRVKRGKAHIEDMLPGLRWNVLQNSSLRCERAIIESD